MPSIAAQRGLFARPRAAAAVPTSPRTISAFLQQSLSLIQAVLETSRLAWLHCLPTADASRTSRSRRPAVWMESTGPRRLPYEYRDTTAPSLDPRGLGRDARPSSGPRAIALRTRMARRSWYNRSNQDQRAIIWTRNARVSHDGVFPFASQANFIPPSHHGTACPPGHFRRFF